MIAENDSVKGLILQDLGSSVKYPRVSIEKDDGTHVSFDNYNEDYEHSRRTPSLGSIGTIEEAAPDTHSKEPEARSRNSSTQSRRPVIPRSKRRGLLARFAVIAEIERPQEYSRKTKWLITLLVALAAAAAPMGSAIFYRTSSLHAAKFLYHGQKMPQASLIKITDSHQLLFPKYPLNYSQQAQ
jgi:hypothetical protein